MIRTTTTAPSRLALALVIAGACSMRAADFPHVPVPAITTVDPEVTGYGTFQSHNQKVVSTAYGIFMTYAKTPFDGALWRLARSVDGGRSFQVIWEAVNSTHPPAIEAANDGTLYLVHGDQTTDAAYFYRLSPFTSFTPEPLATISDAHAQKFSLLLVLTSQTTDNWLAIVASNDDGTTWRLVSQTEPLKDHLYAIGGQRHVTADGTAVGSFTHDSPHPTEAPSTVRFFQASVRKQ